MIVTKEYLIEHGFTEHPESHWLFHNEKIRVSIVFPDYMVAINGLKTINGGVTVERFEKFCE